MTAAAAVARPRPAAPLALLFYLAVALVFIWHGARLRDHYFGYDNDPISFVWYLHWWPWALLHGLDPLQTQKLWHGVGLNLTWTTSVPFLSLLTAPLSLLAGPLLTFNLLCIAMPALGAWSGFLLLRDLFGRTFPCLLGGLAYGFSSYETTQSCGHLNLATILFPPLAILLCRHRLSGRLGHRRFILALTAVALAQLGCSTEILLTATLFGAVLLAAVLLFAGRESRPALWRLGAEIAVSGLLAVLVAWPFLLVFIRGLAAFGGLPNDPSFFSLDPLALLIPTRLDRFGGAGLQPVSMLLTGGWWEQGGYLGIVLLLIVGAVILSPAGWRRPLAAVSLTTIVVFVAGLGPVLHVLDERTRIALPWSVMANLPVVDDVLPGRFTLYLALGTSVLLTAWLCEYRAPAFRAIGIAGLLLLTPRLGAMTWSDWPRDAFFTRANIERAIGRDRTVMILPAANRKPALAWQLEAGMSFNLAAAYAGYTPSSEAGQPVLGEWEHDVAGLHFSDDLQAFCARHAVDDILIGPGTSGVLRRAIEALGWPATRSGDVEILRVPPPASLRYVAIDGDYWPSSGPDNWMGQEVHIMTRSEPVTLVLSAADRPARLGPAELDVTRASGRTRLAVAPGADVPLALAANDQLTIRARSVFIPAEVVGNADPRALSVTLSIVPPPTIHARPAPPAASPSGLAR